MPALRLLAALGLRSEAVLVHMEHCACTAMAISSKLNVSINPEIIFDRFIVLAFNVIMITKFTKILLFACNNVVNV